MSAARQVRGGEQTRQVSETALAHFVDLALTCLDWAGTPPPDYPLHGRSLLPILNQDSPAGWDEAVPVAHFPRGHQLLPRARHSLAPPQVHP